ncbi:MAG TPA: hypothetical protein VN799_06585 [Acidimicrobiales bacterium]|nr:hypothetical protein [Acidimicrobiales bacterium]
MPNALDDFVERYVDLWNEPDRGVRRQRVEDLWAPGGSNATPSLEAVGFDQIEARVASSYANYVGTGVHRFRLARPAAAHHGAVVVPWEMVVVDGGTVASVGFEFLMLDGTPKIVSDHQFLLA